MTEGPLTIETVEHALFWCMIINLILMTVIFIIVTSFRPMILRIHSKLFGVPEDYVSKAIYASLSVYKLLTFFLIVIPWVSIKIISM